MSSVVFSVRRRDLAWAVALVLLLSAVWVARSDQVEAGTTPPGEGIARVYIAVGTGFPDALGVGPGGGAHAAPIIIVPTNPPIPGDTQAELIRLDPREVIIVGGTAVVSASMETALGTLLPNATITRISGADRYATNAEFSEQTFPIEGWVAIPAPGFTSALPATEVVVSADLAYNITSGVLYAPVQLPHGAEILELEAAVVDLDNGQDIEVRLIGEIDAAGTLIIASAASSGTPGTTVIGDTTIANGVEVVDNGTYSYFLVVLGADSDPYVIHVRIRYRLGVSTG